MIAQWRPIPEFPNYSVSNEGFVRNDENGRSMALSRNRQGVVNVGLTKEFVQYKRSVPLLVAKAFVKNDMGNSFGSVINIDGNRFNNRASNIAWRPLWFARRFFNQIEEAHFDDYYPIEELNTMEHFDSLWDAVFRYGLLQTDVLLSVSNNGSIVWPTKQRFRRAR